MAKGKIARIDEELKKQIEEFAEKNEMSFRQASKEMAKLNKIKFSKRKITKEIKF